MAQAADTLRRDPMHDLEQIIRAALSDRYAAPVMRRDGDRIAVLDGRPLATARDRARELGVADADTRVVAIDVATLPWQEVPQGGLTLWRQHGLAGDEGERVTELAGGDPHVQVVAAHDGWQLVRTLDGAMGWLAPEAPELADAVAAPVVEADTAVDRDAFAAVAETFLDVPYVWGGTTRAGVDCSGLVQRCAWSVARCWLPRHSTALLRAGTRVSPSGIDRGDVLVLRRDMSTVDAAPSGAGDGERVHPMHVAVATDRATVVHASRDSWRVVREDLAQLRERYRVLSVRRLGEVTGG